MVLLDILVRFPISLIVIIPSASANNDSEQRFGNAIGSSPPTPTLMPSSLTSTMAATLKNFAKFTTPDPPSLEDGGDDFANVLRLEIMTMASRNHFVLPPNANETIGDEQLEKASIVTALWLDLCCSENMEVIFENATLETVVEYESASRKSLTINEMHEILQALFRKIIDAIRQDYRLRVMYSFKRTRYLVRLFTTSSTEGKIFIPFRDLAQNTVNETTMNVWLNLLDTRAYAVHKKFLEMRKKPRTEKQVDDYVTVHSVLKVARLPCCVREVQRFYTTTLYEIAENFVATDSLQKTIRVFIDRLTEAIEAVSEVKNEWTKEKRKMRESLRAAQRDKRQPVTRGRISLERKPRSTNT